MNFYCGAATKAPLSSRELVIDPLNVDRNARGQTFNYRDQGATV